MSQNTARNQSTQPVSPRPLGLLMNVVERIGLSVTYAYDDLAFVEHNALLFRMESIPNEVSFFFNVKIDKEECSSLEQKIIDAARNEGLSIRHCGEFTLEDAGEEKISVRLLEKGR